MKALMVLMLLIACFDIVASNRAQSRSLVKNCQPLEKRITSDYWTVIQPVRISGKADSTFRSYTTLNFFDDGRVWGFVRYSDGVEVSNEVFHRLRYDTDNDQLTLMNEQGNPIGFYKVCAQGLVSMNSAHSMALNSQQADAYAPIDDRDSLDNNRNKLNLRW